MRICRFPFLSSLLGCLHAGSGPRAGLSRATIMGQAGGQRQGSRSEVSGRWTWERLGPDVLGGSDRAGRAGTLPLCGARRRLATVVALLITVVSPAAALPEPGPAVRAHGAVRGWVDAGRVGDDEAMPEVFGAAVTLRIEGRVIGRGSAIGLERSAGRVAAATQLAFEDAQASGLFDSVWGAEGAAAGEPGRVRIALELAGELVPLDPESLVELTLGLSPGLDGVAVGRGTDLLADFPGAMLARNAGPATAASALVTSISGDEQDLLEQPVVLRDRGFRYYRFRTLHLAPPAGERGPIFLHRGGAIVEPGSTNTAAIVALAEDTARFLAARRWPGAEPYGLLGPLDPATGRSAPLVADPFAQAIAAYALAHAGRHMALDPEVRRASSEAASALLDALGVLAPDEAAPWDDPIASAVTVAAIHATRGSAPDDAHARLLDRCERRLLEAFDPLFGFEDGLAPAAHGVIAWGLTARARASRDDAALDLAESTLRASFRETDPGLLAAQMPFLAWAAMDLAGAHEPMGTPALLAMRQAVRTHTIKPEDVPRIERDLVGGVVFTRGSVPLPSAQSLRPIAALARMLGHPALTPGTLGDGAVTGEIASMTRLLRFVRQLSAGPAEAHAYAPPEAAVGGVRNALWDQRMRPESAALALLAACETLDSLGAISER